jgi:enoyl-[acyl-carrier protein] reductase/trans-2-enoyl-CoA reductase (NAD+)
LLFRESLYGASPKLDDEGRLRADYKELEPEIQAKVEALWDQISDDNLFEVSDMEGYMAEFLRLFGFGVDGVDYDADVNPVVPIVNLI